jgi:hypothetical protein
LADYIVPDKINADLWVVAPMFNAPRYKARWKHYHRFAQYVRQSGAKLCVIEAAFGERTWALPEGSADRIIRVRTSHELWIKENLINLAMERLPEAQYVAWLDADVAFARPNWVGETIHQLQHYAFVQMFSRAQDLDPVYRPIGPMRRSFVDVVLAGDWPDAKGYNGRGATGLAWAARRDALDAVGRLMDFCILGSADWHMAAALFGLAGRSIPEGVTSEYGRRILQWETLAERHIRRNVGQVSGLLLHYWHGKKVDRKYQERWAVLVNNHYNPNVDLKADVQGVWQLEDHGDARSIALRDGIRNYFRERNEDSIDT